MSERLPTGVLVGALLRRVNDAGGLAVVRARGDAQAGAVLLVLENGSAARFVERGLGPDGATTLIESGPRDGSGESPEDYWQRRRRIDPDLWVVALDVPDSERFAAETILAN